ncbi:MAG TPA: cupin domain-containing protein [Leptolyngbya sp.]|nr:cupin domain-containing protein [Leptolyngbya sp.]
MQSKLIAERDNSIQSSQLTGKYKMRLGESIFQPNGYVGKHHHSGPGIRYVTMGEITSVSAGKPAVYKAGESFYDSGEVVHELYNRTNGTVRVLNFEMLPSDWKGSSTIPIDK